MTTILLFLKLSNSMEKSPSWKANDVHLVKKFSTFHGNQKLITVFTIAEIDESSR
jgi:hypothetical protein